MKVRANIRRLARLGIRALDTMTLWVYRVSGGRLGERELNYSMLLLQTVGRKSGQPHTHTLLYIRDGERLIVCASFYGAAQHPAWYLNLQANPRVHVQTGRVHREMIAETASGPERERLWQLLVKTWPSFASYQANVSREIPVVILKSIPDARLDAASTSAAD
jgi:deazaflavin-dependent oxidoreductase (nitroreductase family)